MTSCSTEQMAQLFSNSGWPAFIDADREAAICLPRIRDLFGEHEIAVVEDSVVVAAGWGVPLVWSGERDDLPTGYSDSLRRSIVDHDQGRAADTFVLCAIQVRADATRRGAARLAIRGLVDHAARRGWARVIAPLRPTEKHRYPLIPIDE